MNATHTKKHSEEDDDHGFFVQDLRYTVQDTYMSIMRIRKVGPQAGLIDFLCEDGRVLD